MDSEADLIKEIEADIEVPAVSLMINLDVNDLLVDRSEEEVFDFIGKLKDLINS